MTEKSATHQPAKPVANCWFGIEAIGRDTLRLHEAHVDPYSVGDFWLLRGRDSDLLVDSGSGIVDPVPLIETLTGRPVLAVAMNSYYDHAGAWAGFSRRACHPLDAPALLHPMEENATYDTYLNDNSLRALPYVDYTTKDFRMIGAAPSELLEEGDSIDLGNRKIDVLHCPGRSPGGLVLWEAASGFLFTSDMLYDGAHGPAWPPDEPAAYVQSLERLRDLPATLVCPGHYGTFDRQRMVTLIDNQIASLAA